MVVERSRDITHVKLLQSLVAKISNVYKCKREQVIVYMQHQGHVSLAKKFTVDDAKDGFWQKHLDTESHYKTTFNTPFGRCWWNRVPFGICSAPEVWQRTMHEFVEDLEGVEVIADDFLLTGFGNGDQEVNSSLERHERAFLEKCRLWNFKLNPAKVRRHQSSVKFMGHLTHYSGPEAWPWEDPGHIAEAWTKGCYNVEAIPWDGNLSGKIYASPIRNDRATQTPRR